MPQYQENLQTMVGFLRRRKPTSDPTLLRDFLNQRIRGVLDIRPWAGLQKRGIISVPAVYSTGSVSLTNGSTTVTGSSTAWPVSDFVNTTVAAAVVSPGLQTVTPASMANITQDSLLYVDGAGTPEIVAVRDVTATTFTANFANAHSASFTLTASSLAGRQLRTSIQQPIFTIRAVVSTTQLTIDNPWGDVALTDSSYQIFKIYYTLSPDVRELLIVTDQDQATPIEFHVQQAELNTTDPQRSDSGEPRALADFTPNENGNMQYELYPIQTSARQLSYLYYAQWPEMKAPGDVPPPFINPAIFTYGALSDALRMKSTPTDIFYDPVAANHYEMLFQKGIMEAINADNSKAQMAYQRDRAHVYSYYGRGSTWAQSHAVTVDEMFD